MPPSWAQNGAEIDPDGLWDLMDPHGAPLNQVWIDFGLIFDRFWVDFVLILYYFFVVFCRLLGAYVDHYLGYFWLFLWNLNLGYL